MNPGPKGRWTKRSSAERRSLLGALLRTWLRGRVPACNREVAGSNLGRGCTSGQGLLSLPSLRGR